MVRTLRGVFLPFSVLLALGSCLPDAGSVATGAVMDTLPSGIVLVSNSADPSWPQGESWRVEEQFRLGTVHGAGPELFGSISHLKVDHEGRIWVFDGQAYEFRIFDADGAHLRTVGRRGGGPGEFSQVVGSAWAPDHKLWVFDPGNLRASVFDPDGSLSAAHPFNLRFTYQPWAGTIDADGYVYKRERAAPFPSPDFFIVRYDGSLSPVDSLPGPGHPEGRQMWIHREGNGTTGIRIPFSGDAIWKITPDGGMWIAVTDQYRLIRLDRDADTLRIATKPFDPIPVTRPEVDSVFAGLTRYGNTPQRSDVPSNMPPVRDLVVDDEGNLWVFILASGPEEGRRVEVFDPSGVFLGALTLPFRPSRSPDPVIRENAITAVTTDSLGVRYVVRAKIDKPGES